jgi:hypothetical protein
MRLERGCIVANAAGRRENTKSGQSHGWNPDNVKEPMTTLLVIIV